MKSLNNIVAEKCMKRRLPFERRSKLRRLKDILLESCARNFKEVFVEVDHEQNNMTLKKGVKLVSNIFERILEKCREIYLIMPPECVKCMFRFRDELNWQNIDMCHLSSSRLNLNEKDLMTISKNQTPVKTLSYYKCHKVTDAELEYVSSFSSGLKHLEIGIDCLSVPMETACSRKHRDELPHKIRMPRLEHLALSLTNVDQLDVIDHTSFFGSLREFILHDYFRGRDGSLNSSILIDLLRNCKNLVTLRLKNVQFDLHELEGIFEAISSLKNLRTLEMQYVKRPFGYDSDRYDIARIISNLPKLENLELSYSDFVCSNVNFGERKLKYLGAFRVEDENVLRIPTEVLFSGNNISNFDCLLRSFERDYLINYPMIVKLFANLASISSLGGFKRIDRLENAFLKIIGKSSITKSVVDTVSRPTFRRHMSRDFWAKLITHYVSFNACSTV